MSDVHYYRQCEEKYQALVAAEHPSRPSLIEACRIKTKLLDNRRHSEYKAHCQNNNCYPEIGSSASPTLSSLYRPIQCREAGLC